MYEGEYEKELEEGDINNPFPGDMNVATGETASFLQQTNPEPVLIRIENAIRGNVWDPQKEQWINKYAPLMNDLGINKIMIHLAGVVNTNCIFSNLTQKDVEMVALDVANNITADICANYKEYALSKSDFDRVVDLCVFMCFFSLKRGYLEGERHFVKTAYKSHETNVINSSNRDQGNRSWFPFPKSQKRRN